jgi:predicted phage terminase large subunit-like protein
LSKPPRIADVVEERLRRAIEAPPAAAELGPLEPLLRFSLIAFTKYRMPKYAPSRVHHHVAAQLERVERGEVDRMMIRMPPRSGKSELAARSFPAFCLGRKPSRQFITGSASADLARDIGRSVRNIVKADSYQLVFPNVSLSGDSKASYRWTTAQGGAWYSVGVGGDVLGRGADLWLIDDPFGTMADASSATVRDNVWNWFNGTVYNRLEPGGAIVIIGHRLHEDDLQGRLEERMRAGGDYDRWEIIELPALAEEGDRLGRAIGEPLWPERYSARAFERIRANTFGRDWSALYQQRPTPDEGAFFAPDCMDIRTNTDDVVQWVRAWDLSGTVDGDWSVGVMMGLTRERKVVVGDVRRFRGRPEKVAAAVEGTARGDTRRVRIAMARDPGQAGIAQQEFYVRRLNGYALDFSPESGDKQVRAKPFAVQVNNHNVELIKGDWNAAYREELRGFPFSKHDDQVDASSRAHMVLTSGRAPMRISERAVALAGQPVSAAPLIGFDGARNTFRGGFW